MIGLTSVAGFVGMLDEADDVLQAFALTKINAHVDQFWAEIADSLTKIEVLYEDDGFSNRELAALVLAKVYYHLGAFDSALTFALGAGSLFNVSERSEFIETVVAKCVDQYCAQRVAQYEGTAAARAIDPRLESVVNRMFQRCFDDKQFTQAIGIAIEGRRLDVVRQALAESADVQGALAYTLSIARNLVVHQGFRNEVLRVLVEVQERLPAPDYEFMCRCFVFLNDAVAVASVLNRLLRGDESQRLLLHQICFELYENATQELLKSVRQTLPRASEAPASDAGAASSESMALDGSASKSWEPPVDLIAEAKRIDAVLAGDITIRLHLEFLFRNNKTDLAILRATKAAVENRISALHNATVFANGLMHAGTSVDAFLRENLEWLGRATNWAKFSAVASLGVIHKGHLSQGNALLAPYLPQQGVSGSPYSEGGALFALGLINANHGGEVVQHLQRSLSSAQVEIVQHGAALGLGVAAMASDDQGVFETLKAVLYSDSAVAGEAAGLAMGLVMLGTGKDAAVQEMLQYARDTQHEKIIRGLATGLALIMYQREESAEFLIEQLATDKDPILRYGAMHMVAMAYAGTANNAAIRRLLHVAVSDVSDDVRRAAVTSLGFVLFRRPEQCPPMVQLLAESYNPHVRYGATLALGIACAGTGLVAAVELLEPMTEDAVDFVRQGALLALALILIQQNEVMSPKVAKVRKMYERIIADKHEDTMAKFGAIIGQGIIDAGGRNVTIALQTRTGHTRMAPIVGLLLATQFWYWYPLINMLSLAFTPTAVIGLNKDHQMPKFQFVSNVRPSLFAYPAPLASAPVEKVEKVVTAVLSTTNKFRARAQRAEKEKAKSGSQAMDVEPATPVASTPTADKAPGDAPSGDKDEKAADDAGAAAGSSAAAPAAAAAAKKVPEPSFELLENPARVLPGQLAYLSLEEGSRYRPIKSGVLADIVVLADTRPDEPEELVKHTAPTTAAAANATFADENDEPGPPEDFDWTE